MMPLLRSATIEQPASDDVARVRRLIDNLRNSLETMTADIEAEERQSQVSDVEDIGYSTLAKSLRARHDNLKATINLLNDTLARLES
jgi:predicted DNA binding CopG/RHH family protein